MHSAPATVRTHARLIQITKHLKKGNKTPQMHRACKIKKKSVIYA